jgi:predicted nucleic acid-binding protein
MAVPARVFCDTSFFYACLDPKDANHAKARALVSESASVGTTFCTTWDIVSETVTLLRYRRNYQAAIAFLTDVKPGLHMATACGKTRNRFFARTLAIIASPSAIRFRSSWSRQYSTMQPASRSMKTSTAWA